MLKSKLKSIKQDIKINFNPSISFREDSIPLFTSILTMYNLKINL